MNNITIRKPLFEVPNENKSNVLKYEKDNDFNNKKNDPSNLESYISSTLPYKRIENNHHNYNNAKYDENNKNDDDHIPLDLNNKENMNFFVNKKNIHNSNLNYNHDNILQSYRNGEINRNYNIMDNMYDVYYINKSKANLNDYLKHVNINHTAPCIGEFRTCMNCFLNISTLFCKTCNIFLCAICNVKLHNNKSNHIINVASSGLYENNVKFNDIILKEKDKWLVELDNSIPIKIREKCSVHTKEYIKYVCKTCKYTLLCADCLLNDPVHVQNKMENDMNIMENDMNIMENDMNIIKNDMNIMEKDMNIIKNDMNIIKNNMNIIKNEMNIIKNVPEQKRKNEHFLPEQVQENNDNKNGSKNDKNLKDSNKKKRENQYIVSIYKKEETSDSNNKDIIKDVIYNNDIDKLKPGFKLIRGNHEILTLIDARNDIKEELNNKLEILCKKSLILKNTLPSLRNICKYGKITCKNNKRSIRSGFTVTNNILNDKKVKIHNDLKKLQDKSTNFLKKLDQERINYRNYLEKKKSELQHMIKLSNKNAGLALDYYVQKLESFKCLFFTKDNLIDIEKKLEVPHSKIKSEFLSFLIEEMKYDILNSKMNIQNRCQSITKEFEQLFNCNIEIPVYPVHFRDFLKKRTFNNKQDVHLISNDKKKKQQYFHILPFTDFYMNIEISYQIKCKRKDSLHSKWEKRTVSVRSIYLCIHTHSRYIKRSNKYQNDEFDENVSHKNDAVGSIAYEMEQNEINEQERRDGQMLGVDEMENRNKIENYEHIDNASSEISNKENCLIQKNMSNNLSNDIESIICLSNVEIKMFNDPNITNITILEKRNYSYGIELTEYNDKKDLVGYWLLSQNNEKDMKELYHILCAIKKKNPKAARIPSFYPKINMNNSMFNYHENNISTIYKNFSANLIEPSYFINTSEHEKDERDGKYLEASINDYMSDDKKKKRYDSIESLRGSDKIKNDQIYQGGHSSSLLYYYDNNNDDNNNNMYDSSSSSNHNYYILTNDKRLNMDNFINNNLEINNSQNKVIEKNLEYINNVKLTKTSNYEQSNNTNSKDEHNISSDKSKKEDTLNLSRKSSYEYNNKILQSTSNKSLNGAYENNLFSGKKKKNKGTVLKDIEHINDIQDKYPEDLNINCVNKYVIENEEKHLLPLELEYNLVSSDEKFGLNKIKNDNNIIYMKHQNYHNLYDDNQKKHILFDTNKNVSIQRNNNINSVIKTNHYEVEKNNKDQRNYDNFTCDKKKKIYYNIINSDKDIYHNNIMYTKNEKEGTGNIHLNRNDKDITNFELLKLDGVKEFLDTFKDSYIDCHNKKENILNMTNKNKEDHQIIDVADKIFNETNMITMDNNKIYDDKNVHEKKCSHNDVIHHNMDILSTSIKNNEENLFIDTYQKQNRIGDIYMNRINILQEDDDDDNHNNNHNNNNNNKLILFEYTKNDQMLHNNKNNLEGTEEFSDFIEKKNKIKIKNKNESYHKIDESLLSNEKNNKVSLLLINNNKDSSSVDNNKNNNNKNNNNKNNNNENNNKNNKNNNNDSFSKDNNLINNDNNNNNNNNDSFSKDNNLINNDNNNNNNNNNNVIKKEIIDDKEKNDIHKRDNIYIKDVSVSPLINNHPNLNSMRKDKTIEPLKIINGKNKLIKDLKKIQEQVERKIRKYKIQMDQENKKPPPSKNKINMKSINLDIDDDQNVDSQGIVDYVLNQIGNKKMGQ
ncbi:hypothetical protein PFLG_01450 [Plasmodium falciparum RAJ116]|uniref:B box-type domain-containing protein n=1 Tax=Plasmodium falciparum RAJ116 TaxID=580058 RepID=A0A0L0CVK5_PLAFA|nr:hypothetical protein PFLG_01450 [Plasmodium falciparum RAJ116]